MNTMKTNLVLLIISVTLIYRIKAECNKDEVFTFDCGSKGTPHYYTNSEAVCSFGCKDGDRILSCEEVYPPPDQPEYKNKNCQEKAYDCANVGYPNWSDYEDFCNFNCLVEGDMLFTCEQVHFAKD
ncbi:hypothetical protein ILUMI_22903 [Ignelater luminosus]|uniref:Uncharacterized protein n=1 Tax=Ignelater luminosus TaxID=2038154 RepID=A0A8K0C9S1_IGNLU|nr:hypothetical protein ILUMI_22903 [Ignelater luminosus]